VIDECADCFVECELLGLAVEHSQKDHGEALLHLGVLVELVEHDLGLRTAMAFFQVHVVPAVLYGANFELVDGKPDDEQLVAQALQLGRDVVELERATAGKALGPTLF